jgi:hypothetical protein
MNFMKRRIVTLLLASSLLLSVSAVSANRTDDQSPKIVYATETTGGKLT